MSATSPELITSLSDYIEKTKEFRGEGMVLFRGQQKVDDQLRPVIARIETKKDLIASEKEMFDEFKVKSVPYLERLPEFDWDWLARPATMDCPPVSLIGLRVP